MSQSILYSTRYYIRYGSSKAITSSHKFNNIISRSLFFAWKLYDDAIMVVEVKRKLFHVSSLHTHIIHFSENERTHTCSDASVHIYTYDMATSKRNSWVDACVCSLETGARELPFTHYSCFLIPIVIFEFTLKLCCIRQVCVCVYVVGKGERWKIIQKCQKSHLFGKKGKNIRKLSEEGRERRERISCELNTFKI